MSTTDNVMTEPQSLTEEAIAQGIEITEETTETYEFGSDEDNPLQLDNLAQEGDYEESEENNDDSDGELEDEPDGSDDDDGSEDPTGDLQTEVDRHEKALKSLKSTLKEKGVDFNTAVLEYNEYGSLSQETVDKLAEAGYPPEVVEGFIEGRKALESRFVEAVYSSVGGEKEFDRIVSWAANNLPQKTVDSFNRAIDNNNLEAVSLMLEGMRSKMVAKMGTAKKSIYGGVKTPSNRPKGFANKNEIVEAMSDKRYGIDAEYTRQVEMRMWASDYN